LENGIDGEVFLSGIPKYHTEKKKIVLTDIVFKLKTKSFFQKIALALFKRKIINTIEQDYGIPMEGLENNAKASVENTFNHANYKGVAMNAKVHQILPYQIQLLENTIMVLINTNAMLNVTISNVNN
jgi:ribosomal protein L14E/L6E/L27E